MSTHNPPAGQSPSRLPAPLRTAIVLGLLYLFLVGVKLLEGGIKGLGADYTDPLFEGVSNPLAGLFVGILATVLVQSSSVTTATIVGLVASGVIGVEAAVPMIMGANIGTTVTNTLVSLTHARKSEEFRAAFTAATMHDFFNLMAVAMLLPLELITGFLSKSAAAIAEIARSLAAEPGRQLRQPHQRRSQVAWPSIVEDGIEGCHLQRDGRRPWSASSSLSRSSSSP